MCIEIVPNLFNEEELCFLEDFKIVFKKYPFKVFDILKIFKNKEITYQRDRALIITISKLSQLMVNDLLEFLSYFYKDNNISKIINQKEFLIVHMRNDLIIETFTNDTFYMYIDYYFYLLDNFCDVYLKPKIVINNITEEVDLLLLDNNEYYIFKKEKTIVPYSTYYIDLFVNYYDFKNRLFLKYYISDDMKKIEISKILIANNSL